MIYHVLPGEAQLEEFRKTGLDGEVIVFREALISGPADAPDLETFWEERAQHILSEYGEDPMDYHETVADPISKLVDVEADDEVNLWFEYELFCSVNYWFCLDVLSNSSAKIYRVAPVNASPDDVWKGFGSDTDVELANAFAARIELTDEDKKTGKGLWSAFATRNATQMLSLGNYRSPCFPFLAEVSEAAAQIETRPAQIIRELKEAGMIDIETVFPEFQNRAGVYGFGDLQVERLLQQN